MKFIKSERQHGVVVRLGQFSQGNSLYEFVGFKLLQEKLNINLINKAYHITVEKMC